MVAAPRPHSQCFARAGSGHMVMVASPEKVKVEEAKKREEIEERERKG